MKRFITSLLSIFAVQAALSKNIEEIVINAVLIPEQSVRLPIAIDKLDREHITRARAQ